MIVQIDELTLKKLEWFDEVVDMWCENNGAIDTIKYLLDKFTPEELEKMSFNKEDIDEAVATKDDLEYY